MEKDENVVVLGADVGVNGGVFRATVDLKEPFGIRRVMDTPLAETLIAGMTVGMASQGLKPVCEIQFMGFIYSTVEHIVSHASRMRNRTRGRLTCPMVLTTTTLPEPKTSTYKCLKSSGAFLNQSLVSSAPLITTG